MEYILLSCVPTCIFLIPLLKANNSIVFINDFPFCPWYFSSTAISSITQLSSIIENNMNPNAFFPLSDITKYLFSFSKLYSVQ